MQWRHYYFAPKPGLFTRDLIKGFFGPWFPGEQFVLEITPIQRKEGEPVQSCERSTGSKTGQEGNLCLVLLKGEEGHAKGQGEGESGKKFGSQSIWFPKIGSRLGQGTCTGGF
uniref:Uncharacterized protein n=1 Tax=Pseudonaja textilis TaxID=8673 RepID=A0A670ZVB9_PSETE